MAIIGTIRKHSALAVILVGVAITAFIVSDLFTGKGRGRGGSRGVPEIGKVEGVDITAMEFNRRVEDNMEIQKQNQNKENLTQQEAFEVRNNTWNQLLNEIIMGNEYDKLGLTVTKEELFDLVQGPRPHRLIQQYFTDPNTGQYSSQMVINFLQNLDNMDPTVKKQWLNLEKFIKEDRLGQKYQNLVSKGYYIPEAFARMDFENKKKNAETRYVAVRYTSIPDDNITLTDADYQKYYDKNKQAYKQDASRDIDYLIFQVQPSAEDREAARSNAFKIYDDFREATEIATFVNSTSDDRYDSTWHKKGTLPVGIDSIAFNSPVGTFIPPFEDADAWYMARLMDIQMRPDSMKAEHILISYKGAFRADPKVTRTKEQAQQMADSLLNVLKGDKTKLQALAAQLSDDGSARQNNGDLGWFADGSMVGPFNEAVVNGKVGDLTQAETVFGFHVILITGKKDPEKKVRVAIVKRAVEPSSKTFQDTYMQASTFAGEHNTREKFDQAVTDQGLNKRNATYLREMGNNIPGIDNPREVIRWAFFEGIKVGEVSPVFDVGGAYVVAVLTVIREKGTIPLEQMKDNLKNFVMNEKKAEEIKAKIGNSGNPDIYQIASEYNAKVDTNLNLTFSSRNLPGFGSEYQVIGTTFSLNTGDESGAIQGNGGVFVVKLDKYYDPPAPANYNQYRDQLVAAFRQKVSSNTIFTALQEKASIKDHRLLFY